MLHHSHSACPVLVRWVVTSAHLRTARPAFRLVLHWQAEHPAQAPAGSNIPPDLGRV